MRGHRLHALARQRRQQSGAVTLQSGIAVSVTQAFAEMCHVPLELNQVVHRRSPFMAQEDKAREAFDADSLAYEYEVASQLHCR